MTILIWEVGVCTAAAPGTIYRITNTSAIGRSKWLATFSDLAGVPGLFPCQPKGVRFTLDGTRPSTTVTLVNKIGNILAF